jgi:hypothetical protein
MTEMGRRRSPSDRCRSLRKPNATPPKLRRAACVTISKEAEGRRRGSSLGRLNDRGVTIIVCKVTIWREAPRGPALAGHTGCPTRARRSLKGAKRVRASVRPAVRTCEVCGVSFVAGRSHQRVRSNPRRQRRHRECSAEKVAASINATTANQHLSVANQTC